MVEAKVVGVLQLFGLFLAAGSLIHCGKDGM